MKYAGYMNGWKDAPHQWKNYFIKPIKYEKTPAWISLSIFGFVFFISNN
jgi:hypothetical protein